jgi:hypothetical protein
VINTTRSRYLIRLEVRRYAFAATPVAATPPMIDAIGFQFLAITVLFIE